MSFGRARVVHLAVAERDEDGVELRAAAWIGSAHGQRPLDPREILTRRAPGPMNSTITDLHVLGADDAVRPDAARQPNREPSAARAELADRRTVSDPSTCP